MAIHQQLQRHAETFRPFNVLDARSRRATVQTQQNRNALDANTISRLPQSNLSADIAIQQQQQDLDIGQAEAGNAGVLDQQNWLANSTDSLLQNPGSYDAWLNEAKRRGIFPEDFNAPFDEAVIQQINAGVKTARGTLGRLGNPDIPSGVRIAEFFSGLPEGGAGAPPLNRQSFIDANRSRQFQAVAGVPTGVGAGTPGGQDPLSTLSAEAGAAGTIEGSRQAARERAITDAIPSQVQARTAAERRATHIDEGLRAADSLPVLNRAIQLLDSVKTGGIAAAQIAATRFFGITGADETELSNNLGKAVLSQLRSTFGAQFTQQEGERLQDIEADYGKSTAGNIRLLQQAFRLTERVARRGIAAARINQDAFSISEIEAGMNFSLAPEAGNGAAQTQGRFSVTEVN